MVDYSLHMKQSRLWTSQPAKRTKDLDHSAMDLKLADDVQGKFSAKDVSHDFILYAFAK
jgi:hypothetical protein